MKKGRGRRRGQRWITEIPEKRWFAPEGAEKSEAVNLTFEELEAIRLVDLLELQQQEAALYMGVSRKAFWNDLRSARNKVATALIYGLAIRIEGGNYALRGERGGITEGRDSVAAQSLSREEEIALLEREIESVGSRLNSVMSRMKALKEKGAQSE